MVLPSFLGRLLTADYYYVFDHASTRGWHGLPDGDQTTGAEIRALRDAGHAQFAAHIRYGHETMVEEWAEVLAGV